MNAAPRGVRNRSSASDESCRATLKGGTVRAQQLTATICYMGMPCIMLCIFAATMVYVTSVDTHQILDNGADTTPPPQPLTGGATTPQTHTPWLLYLILGTGYANMLYLLLNVLSSPNAQAEAVVGSRGTRSLPPPRAKSPPSRYQSQYLNAMDRLYSGPSWLTLVYLIELMIASYFRRGASILQMHAQPQVSVFEKVDQRGIYWSAPPTRQSRTPASAEKPSMVLSMHDSIYP